MESILKQLNQNLKDLEKAIIQFVKDNGGFINTQNWEYTNDTIYAYQYDMDSNIIEEYIIGIRIDEDDYLEIAFGEYTYDDPDEVDWEYIHSGYFYTTPTLISIAESLEQYV